MSLLKIKSQLSLQDTIVSDFQKKIEKKILTYKQIDGIGIAVWCKQGNSPVGIRQTRTKKFNN